VRNQNFTTVNIAKTNSAGWPTEADRADIVALSTPLAQCPAGTPSPLSPSTQLAADVNSSFSRHASLLCIH
jgi:hypothetical protein